MARPGSPSVARVSAALGAAVVAVSTAAVLVLVAAPIPAGVIACGRVGVTAVGLAGLGIRNVGTAIGRCRAEARIAVRVIAAGVLLAMHFGMWITSFGMTTVVRSVVLVSTQPLFAGVFGRLIGDRPSSRLYLGSLVALLGSAVMAGVGEHGTPSTELGWAGDLLALAAAAAVAGYLVIGRSTPSDLPLPGYLVLVHVVAAVLLALFVGISEQPLSPSGAGIENWLAVISLGLLPGLVGHGLLNWAVRRVPVHVVSLVALLEPIGAAALAWLLLGRHVGPFEAVGAAIVLCGVGLGLPGGSRQESVVAGE